MGRGLLPATKAVTQDNRWDEVYYLLLQQSHKTTDGARSITCYSSSHTGQQMGRGLLPATPAVTQDNRWGEVYYLLLQQSHRTTDGERSIKPPQVDHHAQAIGGQIKYMA